MTRMARNETEAWLELARAVACSELDAIGAELAAIEDEDGAPVFPVLRAPGDERDTFDDEPIKPGERIIRGRRFYSAAWL